MDTSFSLNLSGNIDLSERVEPSGTAAAILELVKTDEENISLRFGFTEDENERDDLGFFIDIGLHHISNAESKRVFHCSISLHPTPTDLRRLRNFLDYLVNQGITSEPFTL